MKGPRIYNLFPLLVGPVRAWQEQLERISQMGFDWVFVNPFHYPGFSGSLYAVKDYYRLHPLFAEDQTSDEESLRRFCDDAKQHGLRVMMDLVINHTAKDALLVDEHPEWYARDEAGLVRSPFAIDPDDANKITVWGDLAELDYSPRPERAQMLEYWKRVIRHYIGLGFEGFRCDAAYKIPGECWGEIISDAKRQADAHFFAETLGCRLEEAAQLAQAKFDYFFNSAKWWDFEASWLLDQYEEFRHVAATVAFPESHDTERLAHEVEASGVTSTEQIARHCRLRYQFAAAFSTGVMMPLGFELGFQKRPNVVETRPEDWERGLFDLSASIREMNRIKASWRALNEEGPQVSLRPNGSKIAALLRQDRSGESVVLTLVNPSMEPQSISASELWRRASGAIPTSLLEITPGGAGLVLSPDQTVLMEPVSLRLFGHQS